jgi:hypothetical protein
MAIIAIGIDLAKNVFALHEVDATGKAVLVRPAIRLGGGVEGDGRTHDLDLWVLHFTCQSALAVWANGVLHAFDD